MAKYKKKLEDDIRCPLGIWSGSIWRKMEVPHFMRIVSKLDVMLRYTEEKIHFVYHMSMFFFISCQNGFIIAVS